MKTILLMLLFPIIMVAQRTQDETFSVAIGIGTAMTAELEYKGTVAYIRPSIEFNGESTHVMAGFGLNFNEDRYSIMRYYIGGRLGLNIVEEGNATAGYEAGVDLDIGHDLFIGIRASNDYKSDFDFYEGYKKWNQGLFLRFGAEW